tara:strand:+ start:90 stop:278 length:189 start_codon:yes stop_codon:yes gene_type:complete
MTRKHYVLIANAIKENILYKPNNTNYKPIDVDLHGLIGSISRVLKADNERFNSDKFRDYINE